MDLIAKRAIARSRARDMRREPTPAEKALWHLLRDRRLSRLKWRRQVPLGPYILDYVSFERRVIVECDGSQHVENARDMLRDTWLRDQGFLVLRFWNQEVLFERESVVSTILARSGLPF